MWKARLPHTSRFVGWWLNVEFWPVIANTMRGFCEIWRSIVYRVVKLQKVKVEELGVCGSLVLSNLLTYDCSIRKNRSGTRSCFLTYYTIGIVWDSSHIFTCDINCRKTVCFLHYIFKTTATWQAASKVYYFLARYTSYNPEYPQFELCSRCTGSTL